MSAESYLVPMAAGLALGFGLASIAYLGVFLRRLSRLLDSFEVLHQDNVETAKLLIENDTRRADDVAQTAVDLEDSDANVTRKVKPGDVQ